MFNTKIKKFCYLRNNNIHTWRNRGLPSHLILPKFNFLAPFLMHTPWDTLEFINIFNSGSMHATWSKLKLFFQIYYEARMIRGSSNRCNSTINLAFCSLSSIVINKIYIQGKWFHLSIWNLHLRGKLLPLTSLK